MLKNWPSFKAAPRISDSLETRRFMLASVMNTDDWASLDAPPVRRIISEAAPYPREAASPALRR
jgi:hypothetical protein